MPKKPTNTNKRLAKSQSIKEWKMAISITAVTFAIVAVAYDLIIGGNINVYAKWISCGQRPVEVRGSGLMNVGVRHYIPSPTLDVFHTRTLFCTPLEAEMAGYSANPNEYDFPHLRAWREEG